MKSFLLALGVLATPAGAQVIEAPRLTDPELARERGGFVLPGGITITLGVTTDTRVDGQEVLRTIFAFDGTMPKLAVLSATEGGGFSPVELDPGGAGVITREGVVRLRAGDLTRVDFSGDRLDISHLVGGDAFGSVVVNSADNRMIDITTSVDISLAGVRPDELGSSMARVDTLALDATAQMVR